MSRPYQAQPKLYKHKSWSPDIYREDAWQRRKENHSRAIFSRLSKSKSLSEDDIQELKACFELGFGFDSPEIDQKLLDTVPALELYHAIKKQYNYDNHRMPRSSSSPSIVSDTNIANNLTTPIFNPDDELTAKKTRLKQWAQLVACAARQSSISRPSTPPDQSTNQLS